MATPEQLTTRTNALVVAWDQLRTETFRPPVQRHHFTLLIWNVKNIPLASWLRLRIYVSLSAWRVPGR